MAETVVSIAVNSVLRSLTDSILCEPYIPHGVRGQMEWLKRELEKLLLFLKDADAKKRDDENIKKWLKEMIDVASEAQDIVDVYKDFRVFNFDATGFIQRCMLSRDESIQRRKFNVNVKRIKPRILELSESATSEHGLISSETNGTTSESGNPDRIESPPLEDAFYTRRTIIDEFVGDRNKNRLVISICGMSGVGKTTLAASIYNDPKVNADFNFRGWVLVSQRDSIYEILKTIAGTLGEQSSDTSRHRLSITVSEKLKNYRYLIVLDDVRTHHVWIGLGKILPDDNNGSRVIITTRRLDIAVNVGKDRNAMVHTLPLLNEEESCELFISHVFPNQASETCCPEELVDSARKIVRSCGGLPLALVKLGQYMSTQPKNKDAWEQVAQKVAHDAVQESLVRSYYELPNYLKFFFSYFGCFRQRMGIPSKTLIRLWLANDVLGTKYGVIKEKIGMDYLMLLAQISMIEVTMRKYDGSPKYCQIQRLFFDTCISEATERSFLEVYDNDNTDVAIASNMARRVIMVNEIQALNHPNSNLQGLLGLFYGVDNPLEFRALEGQLRRFKLLRVLYLNIQDMSELPIEIKSLIHLRYIELHADNLEEVPSWIGHLKNLQTFVIRSKVLEMISDSLWGIYNLRHVDLPASSSAPNMGNIVPNNLQTLKVVTAGEIWMKKMLPKLTNLCKLNICDISDVHANALSSSIKKLKNLASLTIDGDEIPFVNIISSFSNDHKLKKLYLDGKLNCKQLPSNQVFPQTLVKLCLISSELEHDPMETLEKLPSLRYLELGDDSYVGKKMKCSANHFTKLEFLSIRCCDELEEWNIEEGAMPFLKSLKLCYCPKLKVIPEGLKNVPLDHLALDCLPDELMTKINEKNGDDWYNIQHVPKITIKPL